jgi:hypothetical protein
MRDSFIMYRSFYEAISDLPKENKADILDAIFEYSLNDKESELTGISKTIFKLIKPQLLANNKRFKNGSKPKKPKVIDKKDSKDEAKESETEAKGKQDLSETEAEISKDEANKNVNVNPNENENKNVDENENLDEEPEKKPEVPAFIQQQKGFDLAGKEREEFKDNLENSKLLDIPTTKEYLLSEKEVWRMFRQWTSITERVIFEKVLNEFLKIETGNEGLIYPRPKGKSLFHFQKWTEKRLTDKKELFRIEEIKPIIPTTQLTPLELERQKAEMKALNDAYLEKLRTNKAKQDERELITRKNAKNGLKTLSSNVPPKGFPTYSLQ